MTVNQCVALTDSMLPNGIDGAIKKQWLSELEGRIRVELLGEVLPIDPPDASEDGTESLRVPYPYNQLYWMYLTAMIHFIMGESSRYENSAALFNTAYQNYAKYLMRRREATD